MSKIISMGLDTFGDVTVDDAGRSIGHPQAVRNVVEQGVLADRVGVDFIGLGEHHRDDYAISAPEVALAAIAARTERIKLGSSVTVLSSDDPVRVYERFATLDAVSGGRAVITVGRGSFTESFPLFGYDLGDYSVLFEEKLDLLAAVRSEGPITWAGSVRGPLDAARAYPTTERGSIPIWVGVGGSPESVVRVAKYGMPMALAVIGGDPARFKPFVDLFHRATDEFGHERQDVGLHSGGFIADTDEDARRILWPHYRKMRDRLGRERGWPPTSHEEYEREIETGSLYVGGPETVARRIAAAIETLGVQRFDLRYSNGTLPHEHAMRAVELYGTQVIQRVRELLGAVAPDAGAANGSSSIGERTSIDPREAEAATPVGEAATPSETR